MSDTPCVKKKIQYLKCLNKLGRGDLDLGHTYLKVTNLDNSMSQLSCSLGLAHEFRNLTLWLTHLWNCQDTCSLGLKS